MKWLVASLAILAPAFVPNAGAVEPVVDLIMNRHPELKVASVEKTYANGLMELWLAALVRPEADTRYQAAATIALAHERGMPGLKTTIPSLIRVLDAVEQHPSVRLAAAQALVALDARDAAAPLLRQAESGGAELREIVEPALARWDYKPARALWLDRLELPPPHHRNLILAIDGLATVREAMAAAKLRDLAFSADESFPIRLAAARALGEIRRRGSEPDATQLCAHHSSRGKLSRLLAAAILRRHDGEAAVHLLQELAVDSEPAVAEIALARLVEIDTRLVVPIVAKVLASAGAEVRKVGVDVLFRHPSEVHIRLLGERLADVHPEVRDQARRRLYELAAKAELRAPVIARGVQVLAAADWRGQEQAIYLLGKLEQKQIVSRSIELLRSSRPEVAVAAAWGLRILAVPETLPAALEFVRLRSHRTSDRLATALPRDMPADAVDRQLSQLIQFFGQEKYQPADETLRRIVPRGAKQDGGETRAAAAWTLGWLHEGNSEPSLVALLEKPLIPALNRPPDDERLRCMAAISLGRLKAEHSLAVLHAAGGEGPTIDRPSHASRWAVAQITGKPLPPPGIVEAAQRDWFLIPNR